MEERLKTLKTNLKRAETAAAKANREVIAHSTILNAYKVEHNIPLVEEKKKRGRKTAAPEDTATDGQSEKKAKTTKKAPVAENGAPKKRGRPKKAKDSAESDEKKDE